MAVKKLSDLKAQYAADLQAIIDAGTQTSKPLRTQLQVLINQIQAAEGPDIQEARRRLANMQR